MAVVTQTRASAQRQSGLTGTQREAITGWLFALPWILGFVFFTIGPMLFSLYTSFTNYSITVPERWVGVNNYVNLFTRDPRFYQSLLNTLWMVIVKTPIVLIAALALALLLNVDVRGSQFFRTVFYLPNVLAGAAAVYLWQWMLNPEGLVNRLLGYVGIEGPAWFTDANWTKPGLVVMSTWWIGGMILIFLAGLKGIPKNLYEAGALDGATGWRSI